MDSDTETYVSVRGIVRIATGVNLVNPSIMTADRLSDQFGRCCGMSVFNLQVDTVPLSLAKAFSFSFTVGPTPAFMLECDNSGFWLDSTCTPYLGGSPLLFLRQMMMWTEFATGQPVIAPLPSDSFYILAVRDHRPDGLLGPAAERPFSAEASDDPARHHDAAAAAPLAAAAVAAVASAAAAAAVAVAAAAAAAAVAADAAVAVAAAVAVVTAAVTATAAAASLSADEPLSSSVQSALLPSSSSAPSSLPRSPTRRRHQPRGRHRRQHTSSSSGQLGGGYGGGRTAHATGCRGSRARSGASAES